MLTNCNARVKEMEEQIKDQQSCLEAKKYINVDLEKK